VEFHRSDKGVNLFGWEGNWLPYPIEYKKGAPKEHDADVLQLCCQAMCLEEMLACDIHRGSLFYGENRRRQTVGFTTELRQRVISMLSQMHEYFARGYTPEVKPRKGCNACSLKDVCLPKLHRFASVGDYLKQHISEVE
jgi:CRISPR-associated exonuclease Cas4